jgi:UDP:flavonoid glycosyltransferase YjiC (YdhE family)
MASYPLVSSISRSPVLLTCHDAGGTIPPALALAEALIARGNEVVILSQPSVRRRAEAAGCTFVAFSQIGDYEARRPLEDQLDVVIPAVIGKTVGDDLLAAVTRHRAALVVVDANLAGGLAAAEKLDKPSAVLLHSMYKTFVDTWFGDLWPLLEPGVNEMRAGFGLPAANGWPAVFAGHDRLLAVVPAVFDAPVADAPAALRHFGFLVPRGQPSDDAVDFPAGDDPTVLVGLSTTYAHQDEILEAIIGALANLAVRGLVTTAGQVDPGALPQPPNVMVADYVPHSLVLDRTDVLVTHAGLGSVAGAMTFGVPLVCMPGERDQPLNAQRVVELGAGVALDATAASAEIAAAIERVLSDASYRDAARALGRASKHEGGPDAAAAELEGLLA